MSPKRHLSKIKAIGFAAGLCLYGLSTSALNAQSSALASFESLDSTTKVTGAIVAFDGRTYTVRTPLGDLVLEADQVICTGDPCPNNEQINSGYRISGTSDIVRGLMGDLVASYGYDSGADVMRTVDEDGRSRFELTTDVASAPRSISLFPGSADDNFKAMLDGSTDFVIADREPDARELSLLKLGGQGDLSDNANSAILAFEPITIITARKNSVRDVTLDQLTRILSGRITNWAEIGGTQAPIQVYLSESADGTTEVINDLILKPARASLMKGITYLNSAEEVADFVARDVNGLGIVGGSDVRNAKTIRILGDCGLPMAQDHFSIKSGEYPFVRTIRAYRPETLNSTGANDIWRYFQSDAAGSLITSAGLTDLGLTLRTIDDMGRRFASAIAEPQAEVRLQALQAMMAGLSGAERLSTTFRFASGSLELNARGKLDLSRLLRNLSGPELTGRKIILAGFTDSVGVAERNLSTSTARANLLRDLLLDMSPDGLSPTDVMAYGYGELAPLACNGSEVGRAINQRVEVWVR